jgi:hypothetical protein
MRYADILAALKRLDSGNDPVHVRDLKCGIFG